LTPAEAATAVVYKMEDGGSTWTAVPTTVNQPTHTVNAQINSFSSYAVFYTVSG